MNNIVCLWFGDKYSVDYVNNLYGMLNKNLTQPFNFTCLCDKTDGLIPQVNVVPIPTNDKLFGSGWWQKILFFKPNLFKFRGTTLALDLDMVIVDNIDCFFEVEGDFIMEGDYFPKNGKSTCIMKFDMGADTDIYNTIDLTRMNYNYGSEDPRFGRTRYWGDQIWVSERRPSALIWPNSWVKSYKYECLYPYSVQHHPSKKFIIPKGCKVIKFHGKPTMIESLHHIEQYWKEPGVKKIPYNVLTPNIQKAPPIDRTGPKPNTISAPIPENPKISALQNIEKVLPSPIIIPNEKMVGKLIKECICGNTSNFIDMVKLEIPVKECQDCGIIHQDLDMMPEEYFNFYADDYHSDFQHDRGTPDYKERYAHDTKISEIRYSKYLSLLHTKKKMLDIGSSNNAFVDLMRKKGHEAYGVEIGELGKNFPDTTYSQDLLNIHFPPESFDFITLHDVLEHLIDPRLYLRELHKILKIGGTLVVDFPNFFEKEGEHHWKKIEHLWYIKNEKLFALFTEFGFSVTKFEKPIPSKTVFYVTKVPVFNPATLLYMPGMGDIYWGLTKTESFIKTHDLGVPVGKIWDIDQKRIGTQQRSEGYLSKMGFLKYGGTVDIRRTPEFDKFYTHKQIKTLTPIWYLENVHKCDYMFNMNGFLEIGLDITHSHSLSDYETNWYPPMFTPLDELKQEEQYKKQFGRYIVGYFTGTGRYDEVFNKKFGPNLYKMLLDICLKTDSKMVLIGTSWDKPAMDVLLAQDTHKFFHSLIGKTNTSKMYALMKGSIGVMGWAAGNVIMSCYFKKPTMIFWSEELWNRNFAFNCIDPEALNNWYFPQFAEAFNHNNLVNIAKQNFI